MAFYLRESRPQEVLKTSTLQCLRKWLCHLHKREGDAWQEQGPTLSVVPGLAPAFNNSCAAAGCQPRAARCNGVCPSLFFALHGMPQHYITVKFAHPSGRTYSRRHLSGCRELHAQRGNGNTSNSGCCNDIGLQGGGRLQASNLTLNSMPRPVSSLTAPASPLAAARCKGRLPCMTHETLVSGTICLPGTHTSKLFQAFPSTI